MTPAVERWRRAGRYLPKAFRDFHDQKDLFKTIHMTTAVEKNEYAKDISFVAGQCYVIDIFLWFMARHGYTLQRVRRKGLEFEDLDEKIRVTIERRNAEIARAIGLTPLSTTQEARHDE